MSRKRNEVKVGLIRGNSVTYKTPKPDLHHYNNQVKLGAVIEKRTKAAWIISTLDYPVVIEYNNQKMRLSPRAKVEIADHQKLKKESLPKGVVLKLANNSKVNVKSEEEPQPRKKRGRKKKQED